MLCGTVETSNVKLKVQTSSDSAELPDCATFDEQYVHVTNQQ